MMIEVCPAAALRRGELLGVSVGGRPVLLVATDDGVRAYRDRCPHLGVRLSEGTLEGHALTCRAHCWRYDVRDGSGINPQGVRLVSLPVVIEAGTLCVDPEGAP